MSPELQARLQEVELSWAEGLKTHALQRGTFKGGPAEQFAQWVQPDAGPEAEEEGFGDAEFWAIFAPVAGAWEAARLKGDANGMWEVLEAALVQCHGLRSPGYQKPAATTRVAAEEPRRDLYTGDALNQELTEASLKKRRLQQWLQMWGRPECEQQLRQLKRAIAAEPEPYWAALVAADPCKALLEQLVVQARLDEDQLRARTRQSRRNGWRQWRLAQSHSGMRALFRWIREGPSSMQSTGILSREDGFFSGQRASGKRGCLGADLAESHGSWLEQGGAA